MKHIRMPRKVAGQWLKDLRSGEFKQGRHQLHNESYDAYCCLGVLCHQLKSPEQSYASVSRNSGSCYPSVSFLSDHGVAFFSGKETETPWQACPDPYLATLDCSASRANDNGFSFKQIADAIWEEIEFTD